MAARTPPETVLGCMTFGGQTSCCDAGAMVRQFLERGHTSLDSARLYQDGEADRLVGEILRELPEELARGARAASKANAFGVQRQVNVDEPGDLSTAGFSAQCSLAADAFKGAILDVFYLHGPDPNHHIEETLTAVQQAHERGLFERFGLSNFSAQETEWIWHYMNQRGWVLPTVYQGMYNVITRRVEEELLPTLRRLGMAFYAFNPLAGGLLSGKYDARGLLNGTSGLRLAEVDQKDSKLPDVSDKTMNYRSGRFDKASLGGQNYQKRYMQEAQLEALQIVADHLAAEQQEPGEMLRAALLWMYQHSQLDGSLGDKVIIGASKLSHFEANLAICEAGQRQGHRLEHNLLAHFDKAWEHCKDVCAGYYKTWSASSLGKPREDFAVLPVANLKRET